MIDANFANGLFRGHLSVTESINVDRSAIGPGCRSRQRQQIRLQVLRVVTQCVEVIATNNHGSCIACAISVDRRRVGVSHLYLLLNPNDVELQVQFYPAYSERNTYRPHRGELRRGGRNLIPSSRQRTEFI